MTSLTKLVAALLLLSISAVQATEFYQAVEGKCEDLPKVKEYDDQMVATGIWYYPYASFGKEGDKCATGRLIERQKINYIDLMLFDPQRNRYASFKNDLTYKPVGIYNSADGAVGHIVATDLDKYLYYVQCLEGKGETKVMAILATRVTEVDEGMEADYKNVSAILAEKKLLPKMHPVPQTECPPVKEVDFQ